ncbi:hypothetical protein QQF45_04100 [Halopseudomonas aestusnigri]|nr:MULTISPECIES: hypothetical protein [Halopseudomonas]MEE2800152.1 hypothetical protein [Pseudomonadota bacterium]MCC4262696.1 hypothetical protein [Halopseudomonas aestusnigri]MCK5530044.1 hypothetical protein [Halopseudomonas aestusnigri]MDL2198240.1 hypothetical protein [Halopseudomonas aestusnigri]UGV32030.1 hypothetical protein LO767_05985 [Halopseudomonas aestusnigri]
MLLIIAQKPKCNSSRMQMSWRRCYRFCPARWSSALGKVEWRPEPDKD